MQLVGKVVLVTGAQQGIGRAMALEFAAAGADVAINWLGDEKAAQAVADRHRCCRPTWHETARNPLSRRKPGPTHPLLRAAERWTPAFAGEASNIGRREPPCFFLAQRRNPDRRVRSRVAALAMGMGTGLRHCGLRRCGIVMFPRRRIF